METFNDAIKRLWKDRKRCGGNRAKRLALLIRWSGVYVAHRQDYKKRRRPPAKTKTWRQFTTAMCWVCHVAKATSRHHVIQVQHGGGNDNRNLVPICAGCHAEVHPWMDASEHPVVAVTKEWDEHRF